MILFRYLAREVLLNMAAVTGVLLVIITSGRFIAYLTKAAQGDISPDVLYLLIAYRIPGLIELILPLGLFLGILLAYGRLYLENEMAVLGACGVSDNRLLQLTLGPTLPVALLVGVLSLWVTPWGEDRMDHIYAEQESLTEFDTLVPGRFQETATGRRATYAESLESQRKRLGHVFISERSRRPGDPRLGLVVADSATQRIDPDNGNRYLLLKDGIRYVGVPGQADYRKIHFRQYGVKMDDRDPAARVPKISTLPTAALLASERLDYRARLHWRLSLPMMALVVSILAVPLSRVNPRQGRFGRLLPSVLIYMTYVTLLTSARGSLEKGDLQEVAVLWGIHLLFLAMALNLHFFGRFWGGLWQRCWSWLPWPGGRRVS